MFGGNQINTWLEYVNLYLVSHVYSSKNIEGFLSMLWRLNFLNYYKL